MEMYFFRGDVPNFGDELNPWLMPKVFPGLFDDHNNRLFLGIGSIIFDSHPRTSDKIVFGSGYGGYTPLPDFDQRWSFYCVRGPRTAQACNLGPDKVAGDAAILIHRFRAPRSEAGRDTAFMPHWQSVNRGNWAEACKRAGVRFVDPTLPIEEVIRQIEGSKTLITEAMHGAIVADALRVPWIPVMPIHKEHRMKWYDWAEALDIDLKPYRLWPSSAREALASARGRGEGTALQKATGILKTGVDLIDWSFVHLASARLSALSKAPPMQSSDVALDRVLDKLETSAAAILRDHPDG